MSAVSYISPLRIVNLRPDGTLESVTVFDKLGSVYTLVTLEDQVVQDIEILRVIAAFWKLMYVVAVYTKTWKVANIS